jgi:hypothetical protein
VRGRRDGAGDGEAVARAGRRRRCGGCVGRRDRARAYGVCKDGQEVGSAVSTKTWSKVKIRERSTIVRVAGFEKLGAGGGGVGPKIFTFL